MNEFVHHTKYADHNSVLCKSVASKPLPPFGAQNDDGTNGQSAVVMIHGKIPSFIVASNPICSLINKSMIIYLLGTVLPPPQKKKVLTSVS